MMLLIRRDRWDAVLLTAVLCLGGFYFYHADAVERLQEKNVALASAVSTLSQCAYANEMRRQHYPTLKELPPIFFGVSTQTCTGQWWWTVRDAAHGVRVLEARGGG